MYRTRMTAEGRPWADIPDLLIEREEFIFGESLKEAYREVEPLLKRALAVAPPRRNLKFVWSFNSEANARARRWWFAMIRKGVIPTDGNRYRRTGGMASAFRSMYQYVATEKRHEILIVGGFRGSRYVVGTFDERRHFQIPGHSSRFGTGWWLLTDVAQEWYERLLIVWKQKYDRTDRATVHRINR